MVMSDGIMLLFLSCLVMLKMINNIAHYMFGILYRI